jgi:small subunit ribosomal protein S23
MSSVVQRQLWLIENEGKTKEQAYDEVRREFYRLRKEEEVERRVAQEEARMVGAYFGKSAMQVGMEIEDKEYERWKKWALAQTVKQDAARSQAYTSFGEDESGPGSAVEVEAQA